MHVTVSLQLTSSACALLAMMAASNVNASQLETQLQLLGTYFQSQGDRSSVNFREVCEYLQSLSESQMAIYSQVVVLVSIMLVMPATNASKAT